MGVPQFGAVNWIGVGTLARREIIRFVKVYGQTLGAPVATAALFLAVFTFALSGLRGEIAGLPYIEFLAPGVVMMTVIQNAFANTSSSVMIAKIQGSIVDSLMPPLTSAELTFGFMIGGVARGVILALVCAAVLFPIAGVGLAYPLWALFFTLAGATMLALLGVIAGVWAQKFDHMASITNFIITPLSFLSGTFYSIEALPPTWAAVSHWNPFFYLIDGFRYGVVGVGDANPWIGALVSLALITALWGACWRLFETGYRLKG
ncbi:MAG: ABC transporter permease [Pseudomonadota bacterium]